jgi:hypothetical protein
MSLKQSSTSVFGKVTYTLNNLKPDFQYTILVDGKKVKVMKGSTEGIGALELTAQISSKNLTYKEKPEFFFLLT